MPNEAHVDINDPFVAVRLRSDSKDIHTVQYDACSTMREMGQRLDHKNRPTRSMNPEFRCSYFELDSTKLGRESPILSIQIRAALQARGYTIVAERFPV